MDKKILIIGNGFDLYHKLPTRYTDFLFFANHWLQFKTLYDRSEMIAEEIVEIEIRKTDKGELIEESILDFAKYKGTYSEENLKIFEDNYENKWIEYFNEVRNMSIIGEKWIDFETEINNALNYVEEYLKACLKLEPGKIIRQKLPIKVYTLMSIFFCGDEKVNLDEVEDNDLYAIEETKNYIIKRMQKELEKLINCIRIYMFEFVERIKVTVYSRQIKELADICLLNFNYTYTYRMVYGSNNLLKHHPIHGETKEDSLVLGIEDDSFGKTTDYIYFQKFFQRIQKKTGNYYKKWIEMPPLQYRTYDDEPAKVYIMGHSLGISDKGILKDFFFNKNIGKVTIFYYNQKAYEDIVINLVKMFDKESIIEATFNESIVFEKLEKPIDI
jgi:hypothetical protein